MACIETWSISIRKENCKMGKKMNRGRCERQITNGQRSLDCTAGKWDSNETASARWCNEKISQVWNNSRTEQIWDTCNRPLYNNYKVINSRFIKYSTKHPFNLLRDQKMLAEWAREWQEQKTLWGQVNVQGQLRELLSFKRKTENLGN